METFNNHQLGDTPISEMGVNYLKGYFNANPDYVKMQIKLSGENIIARLRFVFCNNEQSQHSITADESLLEAFICAMQGQVETLNGYKVADHVAPKIEKHLQEQWYIKYIDKLAKDHTMSVEKDYVSPSSNIIYKHIVFNISDKRCVELYVAESEELRRAVIGICVGNQIDVPNRPASMPDYYLNLPACVVVDGSDERLIEK